MGGPGMQHQVHLHPEQLSTLPTLGIVLFHRCASSGEQRVDLCF